ncbi:MAG: precorrin-3B C(17)-methyltransferase [Campylobacterales bacterium]|nr:precorrin-3B C(17)-methyltransferase [Campylobacterales bacterium]
MKKLYILSSGAGGKNYLTSEAKEALDSCDVIVGFTKYIEDLEGLLDGKEIYTSGMTKEIDRCNQAIEFAKSGKTTAIVSNGDVNVYGMATLVVELIDEKDLWDEIEVVSIAGVTTFFALASKVGAPISGDFASISLSDRLTDIDLIQKRVQSALEYDFVVGIYNPKSKTRIKPYENFLRSLESVENRVAVIGSHIGRENEEITITDSKTLIEDGIENSKISMSTLILVGNSNTKNIKNSKVLTPRGYLNKYDTTGNLKRV